MRFDDTLETVLAADVSTPFGKASAWRQIIDLIGRGRSRPDERALRLLASLRDGVPLAVRAASARGLELARPPLAIVRLCAFDEISVAAPLLRSAALTSGEWIELLPQLSPVARAVLRARRDLPPGVSAALASFAGDFAIEADADVAVASAPSMIETVAVESVVEAVPVEVPAPANSTFVSFGAAARNLPLVAAALEQASENDEAIQNGTGDEPLVDAELADESDVTHEAAMLEETLLRTDTSPAEDDVPPASDAVPQGPFKIADVVARIDAFYVRQQGRAATPVAPARAEGFRFETDARGMIRWVDGVTRAPLIGVSLDVVALPNGAGVDGVAAGAFRQRAAFAGARLIVAGESEAAGEWRISGTAAFDPASGRFAGYRGTARRPRADENAGKPVSGGQVADSLRQLMHELRTPTNAIAGFAEMIEHQMLGEVEMVYRQRAATIRDEARALLGAIDDLDLAARIEASALPLNPREVALRPLLGRIADELSGLAGLRGAHIALPAGDAAISGDLRAVERMLARMLATLVSAAVPGETIKLAVAEADGAIAIRFTRPQALSGCPVEALFGMDDEREDAALLGTGFALRLVRNLARELGGVLAIEADRFTIRLPAAVTKSLEVVR